MERRLEDERGKCRQYARLVAPCSEVQLHPDHPSVIGMLARFSGYLQSSQLPEEVRCHPLGHYHYLRGKQDI